MDLSNLSSDLPSGSSGPSVQQQRTETLLRELTNEFKTAANSVAALYSSHGSEAARAEFATAAKAVTGLYRLATRVLAGAADRGYTECLDDLLVAIANGDDIEDWALTRRAEMCKQTQDDGEERERAGTDSVADSEGVLLGGDELAAPPLLNSCIPSHVFSAPELMAAPQHFYPGIPPPSVAHTLKQRAMLRRKPRHCDNGSDSDSEKEGRKKERWEGRKRMKN